MPAPRPSAVLNSKIASMLSMPRRLTWRGGLRPGGQMKSVRAGARLFRREARRDRVPARERRQVPCEGQDVAPMAVLMEQGADLRRIPGGQRRLERREPVLGGTPSLLGGLKLEEV